MGECRLRWFLAGGAIYPRIAIDRSGTPYVVYQDGGNGSKATVMLYNGSSWVNAGSAGFSAGSVGYTSIAIDSSGTPYIVYQDWGNEGKATVMKLTMTYTVSLDKSMLTLMVGGGTATLTATVSPSNTANRNVTWISGDTSVATVDSSGVVTPVGVGITFITVTTKDGSFGATSAVAVSSANLAFCAFEHDTCSVTSSSAVHVRYGSNGNFTYGDFSSDFTCDNGAFEDPAPGYRKACFILLQTVSFNSNGGTPVNSQTVNYNSTATQPADPTKSGYMFGGWYSDSDLNTAFDFNNPITTDTTLYVKWKITNAAMPNITTQPANQTVNIGDSAPLSVVATVSDGGTLSYQWYSNTTNSNSGGTAINGALNASYAAPTATAGTTYYYVAVTNTNSSVTGSQTATATSSAVLVTVNALTPVPVDTIPPITSAVASSVYGPDPVYNFHRSDITLTLTATDSRPSALAAEYVSGVKQTEYRVNGGTWNLYTGPILVQQNGVYTYEYRSTDNVGNVEHGKSIMLKLDKLAPVTLYHFDPIFARNKAGQQYISGFTATLRATDPEAGSGVKTTLYRINGGAWTLYSGSFTVTAGTTKTVEYYSTDHAGNMEGLNKMDLIKGLFTGAGSF